MPQHQPILSSRTNSPPSFVRKYQSFSSAGVDVYKRQDIVYAIDPSSLNKTSLAHGREYSHNHQNYEDDEEEHILDSGTEDEDQLPTKRRKKSKLKTDHNVATSSPEAKLRESARKMFEDLFLKYIIPDTIAAQRFQVPSETSIEELASTFAMELERELFAYNNTQDEAKSTDIYKEKVRVLFSNLKDQKNLQMKTLVVNKALPFSQLVRMSVNEIINPDLQNFRERVDSATLDQLIIEQPHKPKYFKTHKGEELIEDPNAYEPEDMIFSKNILASNHNSEAQVAEVGSEERVDTDPSLKPLEQHSEKLEPQEAHLDDLWRCSIEYKELHTTFSGNAQPIGYSLPLSTKVLRDAFGDGLFEVEGRLKSEEAEKYILQMSSSRAFAVYTVMPRDSPAERRSFEQIHEFLQSRQRYGALKAKRQYVRHVYVIPWEEGHTSEVLKHVELSNPGTTLLNETCFLVVAILRTDMLDLT